MAHAWGDKVRSTHSTTIPGKPSNKRRWREMLDEDGEETGQSEIFNKTVKLKKVVETYFDAASIIDINNHLRQGGLALEKLHGKHSPGLVMLSQQSLEWLKLMHVSCTKSFILEALK